MHKFDKGLYELLSYYVAISRGPSNNIKKDFLNLIPAIRSIYIVLIIDLSEYWISRYLSVYCNFNVDTNPHGI